MRIKAQIPRTFFMAVSRVVPNRVLKRKRKGLYSDVSTSLLQQLVSPWAF